MYICFPITTLKEASEQVQATGGDLLLRRAFAVKGGLALALEVAAGGRRFLFGGGPV
jgi:hypothetical protein